MTDIIGLLGSEADGLLQHVCKGIPKSSLHVPGPDFVDRIVAPGDRPPAVMRSLQQMFDHGRLAGTAPARRSQRIRCISTPRTS